MSLGRLLRTETVFCRHRIPHSHPTGAFTSSTSQQLPYQLLQDPMAFCLQELRGLLQYCPFPVHLRRPYLSQQAANTSQKNPFPMLQPFHVCYISCELMEGACCVVSFFASLASHCPGSHGMQMVNPHSTNVLNYRRAMLLTHGD